MKKLVCLFVICMSLAASIYAEIVELNGYLGEEEIKTALKRVEILENNHVDPIVIEINSTSGNLGSVLDFVKKIYALKAEKGIQVVVYIDQNAVGPAGMIPFIADKLYISFFASWGDIPLGSEEAMPTNLLRNHVKSLISPVDLNYSILNVLAEGMTDPSTAIADQNGWKVGEEGTIISPKEETLVINHNQMQKLGLVEKVLAPLAFRSLFQKDALSGNRTEETLLATEDKDLFAKLKNAIKFNQEGKNTVGLIHVDDKNAQISQATWVYVKSALEYYKKQKPIFIILELNTPGGEVFAAQKISDALKEMDTQYDIPVVAFINNWAISAGAMLAYSCRFIAVTKDASMGAAQPVLAGEGGKMEEAPEKINSALRADFANRASFFDRNPDIAEAMVDKDIVLVYRHGKVIKLDSDESIRVKGLNPDDIITTKGKLLTLNAEDMMRYGVADLKLRPVKTVAISGEEKRKGSWPASKSLLFQEKFFEQIPSVAIDEYQMDWKTRFLSILSSPVMASLLFLGMMIGFYVEINSPGFGFPGSIGLMCLFLIILSSYALEVANTLELILLLVGLAFIALDLFLIPTFGLLGIVGVILFFVGVFGLMLPGIGNVDFELDTQTFNAAGEVFIQRLAWLCGSLVLAIIAMALLGRYLLPSFKGFQPLILSGGEENKAQGYIAGINPQNLPQPGAKGEVMATLRPAGKVVIDQEIYDAVTPGGFIEKGEKIEVVKLDGSVIVVNKCKDEE